MYTNVVTCPLLYPGQALQTTSAVLVMHITVTSVASQYGTEVLEDGAMSFAKGFFEDLIASR